jgi:hypothetical protein
MIMKTGLFLIGFMFFSILSYAQGPLTGTLVINKGEIEKRWGDKIEYEFRVKNAGTQPLDIKKVTGSCDCQTSHPKNIQTIQPGKTGVIKVTIDVNKTQLGNQVKNGVINYDRSVIVTTNGKKEKYQLYTRATIRIKN